jgi:hypothetical protein
MDGMLVHRRLPPQLLLVPIYTPGSREASVLLKDTEKQNVTGRDSNLEHPALYVKLDKKSCNLFCLKSSIFISQLKFTTGHMNGRTSASDSLLSTATKGLRSVEHT